RPLRPTAGQVLGSVEISDDRRQPAVDVFERPGRKKFRDRFRRTRLLSPRPRNLPHRREGLRRIPPPQSAGHTDVLRAETSRRRHAQGGDGARLSVGGIFSTAVRRAREDAVNARDFGIGLIAAVRGVRYLRLLVLVLVSLAVALASD